jgi:hypothetical protein
MLSLRIDPLARSVRFAAQASHKQKWLGSPTLDAAALRMPYVTLPSQGVLVYLHLNGKNRCGDTRISGGNAGAA